MAQEQTPQERARELTRVLAPDWRPTPRQVLWAIRGAIVLGILIAIGYSYDVTLWDWVKLLIFPAVVAAGGFWFNQQQQARESESADRRAQDEALQAYLDQMGRLLLESKLGQAEDKAVRTLARARTLTVLERLNGERKRSVVQFLYEADLIGSSIMVIDETYGVDIERGDRIVDLKGTDLSDAKLGGVRLQGAHLEGALLRNADLGGADLWEAILVDADLSGADLSGADLREVDLSGARGVTEEQLDQTNHLDRATMPNGQKYEEWLKSKGRGEDGENAGSS